MTRAQYIAERKSSAARWADKAARELRFWRRFALVGFGLAYLSFGVGALRVFGGNYTGFIPICFSIVFIFIGIDCLKTGRRFQCEYLELRQQALEAADRETQKG